MSLVHLTGFQIFPCLLLSSSTGYQTFKHGFQISKHVRACRHVKIGPGQVASSTVVITIMVIIYSPIRSILFLWRSGVQWVHSIARRRRFEASTTDAKIIQLIRRRVARFPTTAPIATRLITAWLICLSISLKYHWTTSRLGLDCSLAGQTLFLTADHADYRIMGYCGVRV